MGARHKLNQAHINGTLAVAAVLGVVTQSWTVFCLTAAIGAVGGLHSGGIRLRGRHSK